MKALWNPDLDVDAVLDEMCRRLHGKAGATAAVDAGFPGVTAPVITSAMLGTNFLTGVGMELPDGSPMDITTDLFGATRGTNPAPGPFERLNIKTNTFTLVVGPGYDAARRPSTVNSQQQRETPHT
jgi:hypothetical protein